MITMRIQIEGEKRAVDTYQVWRLIPLEADLRTAAPEKKCDSTSYAEEAGEHIDPRAVADAFDYKVKFAIEAPNKNLKNANSIIANFNNAIRTTQNGSDISIKKEITLYNDRDRVMIVGYPELIAEPKSLYRKQDGTVMDCAEVELTIHVSEPKKCNFNLSHLSLGDGDIQPVV